VTGCKPHEHFTRHYAAHYSEQLQEKTARLTALLQAFSAPALEVFASPPLHYRMRAEFQILA
jgi:tRNA/tmRNA/rRNA uracil-C5-methylase (TrmA/RlmC/RlmD family)